MSTSITRLGKGEAPRPAQIEFKNGGINYSYTAFYIKEEGMLSIYIPAYKLFFSAADLEEMDKRSSAIVKSFYAFWIKQNSWKKFILEIHKLGFKTNNHDFVIKNLLNKKPTSAKFNYNRNDLVPEGFKNQNVESVYSENEIAC